MSVRKRPKKLVVHRTEAVEELLQAAWKIKPEIKNRISLTVAMGIAALIRESTHNPPSIISPLEIAGTDSIATEAAADTPTLETEKPDKKAHPDSIWN